MHTSLDGFLLRIRGARCLLSGAVVWLLLVTIAHDTTAQILPETNDGRIGYGDAEVSRYRVGVKVTATRGTCRGIFAMVAIPFVCDEQEVQIIDEEFSSDVKSVDYRELQGGVRQMLLKIPLLRKGAKATAIVTFEVRTRPIEAPKKTDDLQSPKKPGRAIKRFLGKSPYIETGNHRIKKALREIQRGFGDDTTRWKEVEAIYDYVQREIQYEEGDDKTAIRTLKDGVGDCYSMSALFVALCRTHEVPARMVWVDAHCYPEFYLEDASGIGFWFPCQVAGARAFGAMPDTRTILQKGDNFRFPERPKELLRYASDWASGIPAPGGGQPKIQFIRESL